MGKGNILVVDDEESIRFTLGSFLEEDGYRVTTAVNYDEAMKVFTGHGFDLLYVDIILGGRSGIELLRDIKNLSPTTEVIIVTGAPGIESASSALRYGALDYIVKPVRQEAILRSAELAFKHKALVDAKEKYRRNLEAIFRSVQDAIVTVDCNLNITEANEAAQKLCGIRREEILETYVADWETGCDGACLKALRDSITFRKPVRLKNIECFGPSRQCQIVSATATPLVKLDDSLAGGVMVIRDETRLVELERSLMQRDSFSGIVGNSEAIRRVLSMVDALANVQTSVLVTGESGTGKELVAEALHRSGDRKKKPLVKVNCSALSESLLESELFGHVRGAFTGADRNKIGRFERADGGTIFLDEIGDITPRMQLRFLRVLETMEFERVGESTPITVDVRVIAATNRCLKTGVENKEFREDLFYRLKVVEIHMPALRERREDIPVLVQHFVDRFSEKFGRRIDGVSKQVLDLFMRHSWPGNVRELENVLEHAFILCRQGTITQGDLPADFLAGGEARPAPQRQELGGWDFPFPAIIPLELAERRYLEWAVARHDGQKDGLARELGLSERTLYRKLRALRRDRRRTDQPVRPMNGDQA